jgi:hypothetical protein
MENIPLLAVPAGWGTTCERARLGLAGDPSEFAAVAVLMTTNIALTRGHQCSSTKQYSSLISLAIEVGEERDVTFVDSKGCITWTTL